MALYGHGWVANDPIMKCDAKLLCFEVFELQARSVSGTTAMAVRILSKARRSSFWVCLAM